MAKSINIDIKSKQLQEWELLFLKFVIISRHMQSTDDRLEILIIYIYKYYIYVHTVHFATQVKCLEHLLLLNKRRIQLEKGYSVMFGLS